MKRLNRKDVKRILREAQVSEPPHLNTRPILFYRNGGKTMKTFWDLLKKSVIGQVLIAVLLVGTTCYLWVTGQPVPTELLAFDGLVLGFFFGSKLGQSSEKLVK